MSSTMNLFLFIVILSLCVTFTRCESNKELEKPVKFDIDEGRSPGVVTDLHDDVTAKAAASTRRRSISTRRRSTRRRRSFGTRLTVDISSLGLVLFISTLVQHCISK